MNLVKYSVAWLSFLLVIGTAIPLANGAALETGAQSACRSGESWHFSKQIPVSSSIQFNELLSGKSNAIKSFADALALRRDSRSTEARMFSEYWTSRSLYQLGNVHSAVSGFLFLAAEYPDSTTAGIQIAAFDCLNSVRASYPALFSGTTLVPRIQKLLSLTDDPKQLSVLWRFSSAVFRELIGNGASNTQLTTVLSLLDGAGAHQNYAKGLYSASISDYDATIDNFRRFLSQSIKDPELARLSNQSHLLIARALYTRKRFPEAMNELNKIDKNSNELIEGLSELSWAALQAERYPDAIGTALTLQSGGLRRTFAPEAPMVMAMALNEICQYPESLRATDSFRKIYESSFHWLSVSNETENKPNLYQVAVDHLKKRKSAVPERVASELVRSPVFIASQQELNLIAKERQNVAQASRSASRDQRQMGKSIQAATQLLMTKVRELKAQKKSLILLKDELAEFRAEVAKYRDFRRAASDWRNILKSFESRSLVASRTLKSKIQNDFGRRSTRMLRVLEEVAENNQLIEAEIFHGATKDIIWQNAHPDYKEVLAAADADRSAIATDKIWEWGRGSPLADKWSEIWVDEIGSFKANLMDNCSSKEKYLAIKRYMPSRVKQAQAKPGDKS